MNHKTAPVNEQIVAFFDGKERDREFLFHAVQELNALLSVGLPGNGHSAPPRFMVQKDGNGLPVIGMEIKIADARMRKAWRLCGLEADGTFVVQDKSALNAPIVWEDVSRLSYDDLPVMKASGVFAALVREVKTFVPEDKKNNFDHVFGKFIESGISLRNISESAPRAATFENS